MFNKALYYPWIDIEDMGWLKTSALYWEQVSTIVPKNYGVAYQNRDTRILESEGILRPLIVNSSITSSPFFRNQVINFFEEYEKHYLRLLSEQGTNQLDHRIYWEKIDSKLHSFIKEKLNTFNDEYFMADRYFADFYMTLLANYLSKRNGLSLITDTPILNSVGVDIANNHEIKRLRRESIPSRKAYNQSDVEKLYESMLANISFQHVGVAPDTDIDKIIKYRNKYSDYIGQYRAELKKMVRLMKEDEFESISELSSAIDSVVKNNIKPALNDLEKSLLDDKIKLLAAPAQ